MSFESLIKKFRKVIEKEVNALFDDKVSEISELDPFMKITYISLRNYVLRGGKRLRPIALIMAYKGVGGKNLREIIKASLSVELLHASTLIHDDIMDEDDTRRGVPSMHKQFKNHFARKHKDKKYDGPLFRELSVRFSVSNSIVCGNILQTTGAYCLAASSFDNGLVNRALEEYNNAYRHVNDGQLLDIQLELKKPSEKDYFEMIKRKTGNLFVASVGIGAVLGNANKKQLEMLKKYAESIAIAFQLKDDLMDITPEKGRPMGSDIKKGKKNLLIVKAMEKADKEQMKIINKVLGKDDAAEGEIKEVIEVINQTGAVEYVKNIADKNVEEAKKHIKNAGLTKEGTDFFDKFSDYIIKRKN